MAPAFPSPLQLHYDLGKLEGEAVSQASAPPLMAITHGSVDYPSTTALSQCLVPSVSTPLSVYIKAAPRIVHSPTSVSAYISCTSRYL